MREYLEFLRQEAQRPLQESERVAERLAPPQRDVRLDLTHRLF